MLLEQSNVFKAVQPETSSLANFQLTLQSKYSRAILAEASRLRNNLFSEQSKYIKDLQGPKHLEFLLGYNCNSI